MDVLATFLETLWGDGNSAPILVSEVGTLEPMSSYLPMFTSGEAVLPVLLGPGVVTAFERLASGLRVAVLDWPNASSGGGTG